MQRQIRRKRLNMVELLKKMGQGFSAEKCTIVELLEIS